MLATILAVFVLQAISAMADPKADRYRVHQKSGPYALTHPVPEAQYHIKINGWDYRVEGNECVHRGPKEQRVPCSYDPVSQTGTVHLPDTKNVAWVGFEMYPNSSTQTGYITYYFTQGSTWKQVNDFGCIVPQNSSPDIIHAEVLTSVTVRCARKKRCHNDDRTLSMSVDGIKKCERDGNARCQNFESPDRNLDGYKLAVSKPTTLPIGGKTHVYCATDKSGLSFIIHWNFHRIDQASGPYSAAIPVPMDFQKIKYDNREYDRLPNGMCRYIPPGGGTPWQVKCGYDQNTKTAFVRVEDTRDTAWVGFEMFSSSAQKGYQTVYFTQNSTWSRINKTGCILPQYSSSSVLYAADKTTATILCARKKTCNNNDNTLIMSIEGTKKCEKDGSANSTDSVVPCRRHEATHADVDLYSLVVLKPVIRTNGGKTYVYCGTSTSQLSFVVDWTYKNRE